VTVQHDIDGVPTRTVYGHMIPGSITVTPGQPVERGTVIGAVGTSGASTGAHLHLEVHVGGVPVDPLYWMLVHENEDAWAWLLVD
jgi:murein DD-endopeptidase MepM/ murein hydrolase activator NlpD